MLVWRVKGLSHETEESLHTEENSREFGRESSRIIYYEWGMNFAPWTLVLFG